MSKGLTFLRRAFSYIKSKRRRIMLFFVDVVCIAACFAFSWIMIIGERVNKEFAAFCLQNILLAELAFFVTGAYGRIWRYAQIRDYVAVAVSTVGAVALGVALNIVFGWPEAVQSIVNALDGRSKLMYAFIFASVLSTVAVTVGIRMIYKLFYDIRRNAPPVHDGKVRRRTLIVGGGQACWLLLAEIQHTDCEYDVIGIVDDDAEKIGRHIQGVSVFGPIDTVAEVAAQHEAEVLIIAIPSAVKSARQRIVQLCNGTGLTVKIIPEIYNIVESRRLITQMRGINVEDLLGRDPIVLDVKESAELINGRMVMVTGGGGSIGSELCRQIVTYAPSKLVIVDISENNAYDIQQELVSEYGAGLPVSVHISSVRDFPKMELLFKRYKPSLVFHAAAHKHVPLMENDPEEALKNNVVGTYNVAYLAAKYGADRFVLISSDKAVNPTNVMGATKRFCEMLIQHFDSVSEGTEFCAVRFGNVLGSNGSVIPLFNKLISQKKDLPVTHPEITRYFMTIPEAVSLVLRAGAMAKGGEIFVLDMGDPVKIVDLARNLIRLHGYVPDRDIKIKYVGLRPGEKLYEETLMGGNLTNTYHDKIFIEEADVPNGDKLLSAYDKMCAAASRNDGDEAVRALEDAVPTFKHVLNV